MTGFHGTRRAELGVNRGLQALGITAEAEEVYRYFLRHPGDGVGAATQALDLDADTVEAAVATLRELGLLDVTEHGRVTATEPQIGIERLIETRLDQLNSEIRRVLASREAIISLLEDHRLGSAPAGGSGRDGTAASRPGIERIEGVERVRRRLDDLSFFAYEEMLCLRPAVPLSKAGLETMRPLELRCLRRGVRVKVVYHSRLLDDAAIVAHLRDTVRLGAEVRVTGESMDPMLIFDRGAAVVPIDPERTARGMLLVREPGLVSQLVTYFHNVWQAGTEPCDPADPDAGAAALSQLEQRVLAALATAEKDEVAARQVDVSVRTYRRYVADLMARLGAVNRFQAALRAKEKNWI